MKIDGPFYAQPGDVAAEARRLAAIGLSRLAVNRVTSPPCCGINTVPTRIVWQSTHLSQHPTTGGAI